MRNKLSGFIGLFTLAYLVAGLKPELKAKANYSAKEGSSLPAASNIFCIKIFVMFMF